MSELRTVRYHNGYHYCAALMKRGRKHLHLVHIEDCGVVVKKEPLSEERHLTPLEFKGKPYPITRAVRQFKAFGRERGITQAAINIINEAKELAV
jgi:hypothetical protein